MINDEFFVLLENRNLGFLQDPIYYEIIRSTWIKTAYPQMLTHPYTAEFLYLLLKSKNVKNILEIGTFTAFTSILFAKNSNAEALIYTIEKHKEYEEIIYEHMAMANVTNKIKVFFDDALNVLSKCQYNFDIIYIDADKINYPRYLDLCYNILNNDGIMIFDNIDWYGNIEKKSKDKKTINIQELKNKAEELQILYPKRVKQMTLPIGDGILLIQKS